MATTLIINADDLGFSSGVTDGILRSFRDGALTSATLMTTMPDRDRAIDLAGQTTGLGVGIHLCLTQGKPLTRCSKILSDDGEFFRSLPKLFLKLRSRHARQQAEEELIAQIAYARRRGVKVTHVDSHKHVVHLPALHAAVIEACRVLNVTWIRTAREIRIEGSPAMTPGYRILAACAKKLAARVTAAGLKTNDWFFGLATTGRTDVAMIEKLARCAPPGIGELMVHPGYVQDIAPTDTRLISQRVAEMEALCDPRSREALAATNITLAPYPGTPAK